MFHEAAGVFLTFLHSVNLPKEKCFSIPSETITYVNNGTLVNNNNSVTIVQFLYLYILGIKAAAAVAPVAVIDAAVLDPALPAVPNQDPSVGILGLEVVRGLGHLGATPQHLNLLPVLNPDPGLDPGQGTSLDKVFDKCQFLA